MSNRFPGRIRCPFAPICHMVTAPLGETDALVFIYPAHAVKLRDGTITHDPCPGTAVQIMRNGEVHGSEHARLAEQLEVWTQVEAQRRRDERNEAAEFDEFASRAAQVIEQRMRDRNRGHDVPLARDGFDEQTIREILDDDSHRLVDREATDADVIVGPWPTPEPDESAGDTPEEARAFWESRGHNFGPVRATDPEPEPETESGRPWARRDGWERPVGESLGRGKTAPDDAYPSGQELDDFTVPTPSEVDAYEHGGVSLGAGPDRPEAEYFPGRPADAPEPAPGEPPAVVIPWDAPIDHTPLGHKQVDNAREQLLGLLEAIIEQAGQGQDILARGTAMTDSVEAYRISAAQAVASAESLVAVAIGGDPSVPPPAERLRSALIAIRELLAEAGEIHNAIELLRERIATAHRELGEAAEAAREYSAMP